MTFARRFSSLVMLVLAACAAPDAPRDSLGPRSFAASQDADTDLPDGVQVMPTVQAAETKQRELTREPSVQALPITYHGGRVLSNTKVQVIYWASAPIYAGAPAPGTGGPGTADGSIVGEFIRNLGGSPYWKINNAYTDQFGGRVGTGLKYTSFWATAPGPAAFAGDKVIRNKIISGLTNGRLTYDQQTVYLVFAGPGINLGGSFGAGYCAYHYYFVWGTKTVVYSVLPYVQDFPGRCTRLQGSPNNDFGADAIVTAIAHEVSEAASDPAIDAWYDANRYETADKCVWTFGSTFLTPNGAVANITLGSRNYLVQQNWKRIPQVCGMS